MNDATTVTASAVKEIAELAERASIAQVLDIGDYKFTAKPLMRISTDPMGPPALEFYTLEAFAAYLKAESEAPEDVPTFVHVESPRQVTAVSALYGADNHLRRVPARAVCKVAIQGFSFNSPVPLDTLNIALQTCFEPRRGQIDELRKFCAAVRDTNEVRVADDGVSQEINAKRGVAAVQPTPVVNPWSLAPWRTFSEVAQPVSPFVLRFIQGDEPRAGLYETGDASWQVDAVRAIAKELRSLLGDEWTVFG